MTDLSTRIESARKAAKLTPHGLEREAMLSAGTVARLESGERTQPTVGTLLKLSRALGVRFEWLATGKGKRQ